MSHYFPLILLSIWSQSETIAASKCFKYIEIEEENESSILENMVFISFSYHESWNRKGHGSEYWTACNIKIRWGRGGGGHSKNPFPVIAYSVAHFRPHPSRLSRFCYSDSYHF